ncbi:MAG: cobalamin-dependent protein [Deltaproteobacteria bacterium]|nr:MAG: cobalamin-dependent protein [Deltaproteobacteria bacterium]
MQAVEKILLIYPPSTHIIGQPRDCAPPLGIAYLGAVLKKDHKVKLLDATAEGHQNLEDLGNGMLKYGLTYQRIEDRIADYSPDLIGLTCLYSSQMPFVRKICQLAKKLNTNTITIVGGTHPAFLPHEVLREESIDFITISEGEATLPSLLERLERGQDYADLDGIAFRRNGQVYVNPRTTYIEDLDELPFPAWELLPMEEYSKINIPMGGISKSRYWAPIITSRGCTAKCIFCSSANFWGNRYRTRSVENVLSEIELLISKYKIKEIQFCDDNLILDKERAKDIFHGIIDRGLKIFWNTPNGITLWRLDEELLELMKASGCYELDLAIESGDQEVLSKIIKKPLNLAQVESLTKSIHKLKIRTHSFFIVGFPGETKEQIRRTFSFARKLRLTSAGFYIANPLPGSKLYEICKERGYLKEEFDFETINFNKSNYETPEFTSRELENIRDKEYFIFNLGLLFRNPIFFVQRYLLFVITNPLTSLEVIKYGIIAILKTLLNRRKT